MRLVKIHILDEVNAVILGLHTDHIMMLYDLYARKSPDYFFNPKFKLGVWDGNIHYFHKTGKTYVYLLDEIIPKIIALGYKVEVVDDRTSIPPTPKLITNQFFAHIRNPENDEPIILWTHQVDAVNSLLRVNNGVVVAGTGAGKDQPLDAKILTTVGWVKMGDITLNHYVVTPAGSSSRVVGIYPQGTKDVYEITFHDGSKTRCGINHLWRVKFPKKLWRADTEDRVVTLKDIKNFLYIKNNKKRHVPGNITIPLITPPVSPDIDLPIPPYVLGVLLGDGCITQKHVILSKKDSSILRKITTYAHSLGMSVEKNKGSNCDYRISGIVTQVPPSKTPIVALLEGIGLMGCNSYTKFIPEVYKLSSTAQKIQLLQGLFDTDGTIDKRGNVSFTTTSKTLAVDVQKLLWSVGAMCTITTRKPTYKNKKRTGRLTYTLHVRHKTPRIFFTLTRKLKRCRKNHGDNRIELGRRVVSVKKVAREPTQCIMIDDPNHLYVTDDYIVTHNTYICGAISLSYNNIGYKVIVIVPSQDLVSQTKDEFEILELDVGEYSGDNKDYKHATVVSTWQALKNNPLILKEFNVVLVDECHGVKGNVLTELLNNHGKHIAIRYGVTGTLPKEETNAMAVQIAIGDVRYTVPSHQLIKEGILAKPHIDIFQLKEDFLSQYEQFKKENPINNITYTQFLEQYFPDYEAEKSYLHKNKDRLNWLSMYIETRRDLKKGNVFCLVDSVNFGKKLAESIPNAKFVHGKDKKKTRKKIYELFKTHNDLVVIATVHIAGTGLNIKRIFNLILVDIGKSFIRVIQTIGRGLRKAHDKDAVHITDVCSNLKYSKRHLRERKKYYKEAQYPFKEKLVDYMIEQQL